MEEENSNKIDVSYGVEKPEDSSQLEKKPAKKTKKKSKKKAVKKETTGDELGDIIDAAEEKPKKNLIEEINEMKANNKTDSSEFRKKMGELETVLGVDQISPFGTNELDVFEEKLSGMNYADMREIASRVGINPYMQQNLMKGALIKEFKSQNKNNMRNIMPQATEAIKLDPNNPQHAKTIEILGDI